MTPGEIETALTVNGCAVIEDGGYFALVYPFGYEGRKRSQDLTAKTRAAALAEAWAWLHPEKRVMERIEIIQRAVSNDFGVSIEGLRNGNRAEPMATARRVAMALAATITPASTYCIGTLFGGREHHTVLYAKQSVKDQGETDLPFAARVDLLKRACLAEFEKGAV